MSNMFLFAAACIAWFWLGRELFDTVHEWFGEKAAIRATLAYVIATLIELAVFL